MSSGRIFHCSHRHKLAVGVEVERAGEIVRRRDALGGNKGTVGAAAHSDILRLDIQLLHSLENVLNAFSVVIVQRIGNVAVYVVMFSSMPAFGFLACTYSTE